MKIFHLLTLLILIEFQKVFLYEKAILDLNIELLKKIPFSREIAENYSKGILYSSADKGLRTEFLDLFENIKNRLWK